jgi:flagellar biosynthesis protein FlhB
MAEREGKIFAPLPQRRQRMREQGEVARSRELTAAVSFTAFAFALGTTFPFLVRQIIGAVAVAVAATRVSDVGAALRQALVLPLAFAIGCSAMLTVVAVAAAVAQNGVVFAPAKVTPDLARLNPFPFFARMFSSSGAAELAKATVKVVLLVIISWKIAVAALAAGQSAHGIGEALAILGNAMRHFLYFCAALALVTGGADYAYKFHQHESELRMTRQELLDELRQEEGNPQVKRAIKRVQRKRFRRMRGIHQAATATVVITNPTHLAVGLRYRRGFDQAPLMVAKGAGEAAQRVIEIGRLAAVPVLENKALARALFKGVEVGEQIPRQLYRAVAEVLAMIMRMERRRQSAEAKV